jgi:hypothetical protein
MKLSDIAQIILQMKSRMPESSRTLLAHKFVQLFGRNLTERYDGAKLQEWADNGGVAQFFDACELLSGPPNCGHDIAVHDSDLATYINRWMNIEQFKRPGGDFEPITADMNDIRVMMVEELKGLYEAQKRVTDHERQSQNQNPTFEVQEPESTRNTSTGGGSGRDVGADV